MVFHMSYIKYLDHLAEGVLWEPLSLTSAVKIMMRVVRHLLSIMASNQLH